MSGECQLSLCNQFQNKIILWYQSLRVSILYPVVQQAGVFGGTYTGVPQSTCHFGGRHLMHLHYR